MRLLVWAVAAVLLAGCVTRRSDLHEPWSRQATDARPLAVVSSGRALPIVVDRSPENWWAAMLLADVLAEMTGCRPVVNVEEPGVACDVSEGLFVGNVSANRDWSCDLASESPEAFRVVVGDGAARFLGRADFAVYDWCERELGFRYYCEAGRCVGRRPSVVAAAADYSDRPVYDFRRLSSRTPPLWLRVSRHGSPCPQEIAVHQPQGWFADKAVASNWPCLFETGRTPMLCYGNPDTLAYYCRRIDRHIAGLEDSGGIVNTNNKVVSVCQWDAPVRCGCSDCRALYDEHLGQDGNASPIVWGRFLVGLSAWLKSAHPDYTITFLPYLNTCAVPEGMPRLDNAVAEVCTMSGLALMKNEACRRKEERLLRDWHEVTGRKVLNWNYGCWPQEWTAAPYVFGRTIQRHYQAMRDDIRGAFVCGGATDARLALSVYVWMRCLWNPDFDLDALYDGFARRMFGSAARPMRELIALQETCWNRPWSDDRCSYRNVFETSFPRPDVERMRRLLSEAIGLADRSGSAEDARRVRWYASGLAEFVVESDVMARRVNRRVVRPGETNAMVSARHALNPTPWVRTTVRTEADEDGLVLTVRCDEPAAARDWVPTFDDDFVFGDDGVTFVWESGDQVRTVTVGPTGRLDDPRQDFGATVSLDGRGWTVRARILLTPDMRKAGRVLGNVTRWRVGDRRRPVAERVPDSRYDHSRLNTCYTNLDADPAAFVCFELK